jgi:uncharacterized protein (TIGR03435 family)
MTARNRLAGVAGLLALFLSVALLRDTEARLDQPADRDRFDVASVKPNKSGGIPNVIGFFPGGRLTATNVALRELIRLAYDLQPSQLVGGPDWINSSRFDVAARADVAGRPSLAMIRSLLAERFQLTTHRETRELPTYALVMARADRRLGPQFRVSRVDCAGGATNPPADGRQYCDSFVGAPPRWFAAGVTMAQLTLSLSRQVRATVVDQTELAGAFDVELQWTPEGLPPRPAGGAADQPMLLNGFDVDPDGPSIFTALQEQLGLKLDSRRAPVEVLVIDRVSTPSPD